MYDKASEYLDLIEEYNFQKTDFHRACQVRHLGARILAENGQPAWAREILSSLLNDVSHTEKNWQDNRELLWVQLNLSHLLE